MFDVRLSDNHSAIRLTCRLETRTSDQHLALRSSFLCMQKAGSSCGYFFYPTTYIFDLIPSGFYFEAPARCRISKNNNIDAGPTAD